MISVFLKFFVFCGSVYTGFLLYHWISNKEYGCLETKIVKTIGGCDTSGHCGILFEDGSYGDPYQFRYPIIGQKLCTKYGEIKAKE